jgi:hypothetical protein
MQDPIPIAAGIVSTVALLAFVWALRQPRNTRYVGPAADWWETLRSVLLPLLDRHMPGIKWAYTLHEREYVGYSRYPPEEMERILSDAGFHRMPLAAYKDLSDGTEETGSWAYRDGVLAADQLHVMLFPREGGTAIYAHSEPNALNPFRALKHYRPGDEYDPAKGAAELRHRLPSGVWDGR